MKNNNIKSQKVKKMTFIALFCAIAFVISMIFPIKVMFLTLDFKDSVIAICGMIFGPVAGLSVAVIVPCIELLTSDTGFYGLIMNILSSVTFTLVSSLIYKYRKTIFGAVAGLLAAVPLTVGVMILANLFITPLYMEGADINTVIKLIPTLLLPFNLVKSVLNAAFVMLLYKPISRILKKSVGIEVVSVQKTAGGSKIRSIVVTLSSAAVLVVGFIVLFLVLGGKIN